MPAYLLHKSQFLGKADSWLVTWVDVNENCMMLDVVFCIVNSSTCCIEAISLSSVFFINCKSKLKINYCIETCKLVFIFSAFSSGLSWSETNKTD